MTAELLTPVLDIPVGLPSRRGLTVVPDPARKAPVYRKDAEIARVIEEMRRLRRFGTLTPSSRRAIAKELDVTERSLRNWLRAADAEDARKDRLRDAELAGEDTTPFEAEEAAERHFTLSREELDLRAGFSTDYAFYNAYLAKAIEANKAASERNGAPTIVLPEVHRTTFLRAMNRHGTDVLAGLRGGDGAVSAKSQRFAQEHELGDVWVGDLSYLPIPVRMRTDGNIIQPLRLAFREPVSGRIMSSVVLPERPTAEMIAATIAQGLLTTTLPDGTPLVPPRTIRLDNAGEHVAAALRQALAGIGISVTLNTDTYASWQGGTVEKFWHHEQLEAVAQMAGNKLLGLTRQGEFYRVPGTDALAFDDVAYALTHVYTTWFNTQRHSEARGGRVPDQVWVEQVAALAQPTPSWPADELVADLALEARRADRKTQLVYNTGVKVGGAMLTGNALAGRIGTKVHVRRYPSPFVQAAEVYALDGTYLGRVRPAKDLEEHVQQNAHCRERHTRDRVASAKHIAIAEQVKNQNLLSGPAAKGPVRPYKAGAAEDYEPGETIADVVAADRDQAAIAAAEQREDPTVAKPTGQKPKKAPGKDQGNSRRGPAKGTGAKRNQPTSSLVPLEEDLDENVYATASSDPDPLPPTINPSEPQP